MQNKKKETVHATTNKQLGFCIYMMDQKRRGCGLILLINFPKNGFFYFT